jgi:FixJ family two-component response regulator
MDDHAPIDGSEADPIAVVLDDEESLREIMCRILRGRGFTVIGTSSPTETLAIFRDPGARVDILVTDLGAPTGFGVDVARQAVAARPGLPVLYVSGLPKADAVRQGLLDPDARLLQKPFRREDLAEAVRAALAGDPVTGPR